MYTHSLIKTNERDLVQHSPPSHSILCIYVLCNIVIFSSLVHHVRRDDGLIEKGRNMLSIFLHLTP